jgi:hypothetical protein
MYQMSSSMIFVVSALPLAFLVVSHETRHQGVLEMPQYNHIAHWDDDAIDISTGAKAFGLTTFANLPYMNCFDEAKIGSYDIAIMGAPFDTVSNLTCCEFSYL